MKPQTFLTETAFKDQYDHIGSEDFFCLTSIWKLQFGCCRLRPRLFTKPVLFRINSKTLPKKYSQVVAALFSVCPCRYQLILSKLSFFHAWMKLWNFTSWDMQNTLVPWLRLHSAWSVWALDCIKCWVLTGDKEWALVNLLSFTLPTP